MSYSTNYSESPNGRAQIFWVVDQSGDTIATVKSVNQGKTWQIDGLFPATSKIFQLSQTAIEQAIYLFERRRIEWADRELMTVF
jgi:hypothetical protein